MGQANSTISGPAETGEVDETGRLRKRISEMRDELALANARASGLREQLEAKEAENSGLRQTLRERESSLSWRFSQFYGRFFSGNSIVTRNLSFILNRLLGFSGASPGPEYDTGALFRFLDASAGKSVCLVSSGTKFVESEGQRPLRMARELAKKGYVVIFTAWRWAENDSFEYGNVHPGIFQIPMGMLEEHAGEILEHGNAPQKFFLIQFPHPRLLEAVSLANSYRWATVYDVMDDWGEFKKAGNGAWYDAGFEAYLLKNCDLVTVVSPGLADKMKRAFGYDRALLVPNGVAPEALGKKGSLAGVPGLQKGAVTIGYFGYMTDAWFDWRRVIATAKRHPEWTFHLIGYGKPETLRLPENVLFFGRVEPADLGAYAASWDVAIIPFTETELSSSADPIKVYEYLYFGVPVVATGIPCLTRYPYVLSAGSDEEFEAAILKSADTVVDSGTIRDFIENNSWDKRVRAIIEEVSQASTHPLKVG